jgi:hypothetical protein
MTTPANDTVTPYARAYRLIEEATPDQRAYVLHHLTTSNPEARRLIIALLDPDEVMLAGTTCDTCDTDPCACTGDPLDDDECCLFCGPQFFHDNPECPKYDPRYDEPAMAGEVTGYDLDDNGPTYW